MCNNAVQLKLQRLKKKLEEGRSDTSVEALMKRIDELERKLKDNFKDYYHANAFEHPKLRAFVMDHGELQLQKFHWGLIPHWVKSDSEAKAIMNKTVNARGESLFEKAAFRDAALQSRCIVPLNGYFEHQHKRGKTFPYLIRRADDERLWVGGITSVYTVPQTGVEVPTFSIVTSRSNKELAQIHNHSTSGEARMPLILNETDLEQWLLGDQSDAEALIRPNSEVEFAYHTVARLTGAGALGNVPEVLDKVRYAELEDQGDLFG